MTGKELIKELQKLPESELNKDVIIFDGPAYATISRVEILNNKWSERLRGKILID